jgi:hypothetical protein
VRPRYPSCESTPRNRTSWLTSRSDLSSPSSRMTTRYGQCATDRLRLDTARWGYEFGIFWSVIVGVFMVVVGGTISLDAAIRRWIQASGRRPASVCGEAPRWSVA